MKVLINIGLVLEAIQKKVGGGDRDQRTAAWKDTPSVRLADRTRAPLGGAPQGSPRRWFESNTVMGLEA